MMKKNTPFALAALALATASSFVSAAPFTWNGGAIATNSNWTNGGNWVGGIAPQAGDTLSFGANAASPNNDFPAGTAFAGISILSSAASGTIGGNSINLTGDIVQGRGTTYTINTPLVLQNNLNFNVPGGGATLTLGGATITGSGITVSKTGPGLVVYNNAVGYTGGSIILGGTLRTQIGGNSTTAMGPGAITIKNNGTMRFQSTSATTVNSDFITDATGGFISLRANTTFSPASLQGTGTVTLTGDAGVVATPTDFKNFTGKMGFLGSSGATSNALTVRLATAFVNDSLKLAAVDVGANVFVNRQSGSSSNVTVDMGSLSGNSGLGVIGMGGAAGGGTVIYSVGSRNEDTTFAGNIADGGMKTGLKKVGTGTLILTGVPTQTLQTVPTAIASNFSGASSVDAGALLLDGQLTSSALTITVNAAGTLGGTGSMAGSVTVAGGKLAPGNPGPGGTVTPGTLTVASNVTLNSAAQLNYELNGNATTIGGGVNDLLTGLNNLTLDGTLNLTESVAGSFATMTPGSSYRLINYSGTLTNNTLELGTIPAIPAFTALSIDTSTAGQVNLTLAYIPEPSVMGVMAAAAPMLMRRRRRA